MSAADDQGPGARLHDAGRRSCLARAAIGVGAGLCTGLSKPAAALAAEPLARVEWPPLRLVDGSTLEPEDLASRPAIVVFWATWCPFCRRHNAHVDALFRASSGHGPRVLGAALDADAEVVGRYLRGSGHAFPVVHDVGGRLRERFTDRRAIPMTCVVDRGGRIVQRIAGEMGHDDVMALPRLLTG